MTEEPKYPEFHLAHHIKIEETEYVNDELVPVLQLNVSVSKEAFQDHYALWLNYFKEYRDYKPYLSPPTPEVEVKNQIITAFVDKFGKYLWDKMFRKEQ